MTGKFGFDLLRRQILDLVKAEFDAFKDEAIGDTPIEKLFYHALLMKVSFGQSEYRTLLRPKNEEHFLALMASPHVNNSALIVRAQVQLEDWRVDFVISALDYYNHSMTERVWRHLIVECDGHAYHERTKEQAAKDRSRDRSVTAKDMQLFRFTGSELWRDPLGCAEQVIEWAEKGFG